MSHSDKLMLGSSIQYGQPPPAYSAVAQRGVMPSPSSPISKFAAPTSPTSPVPTKAGFSRLAPGESVEKLLDPPPPCFRRRPPPSLPNLVFEPMEAYCKGSTLNKGFPETAPPSAALPHPFVLYDVTEEDWKWFLYTVKISASLSPLNRIAAGAVPMVLGLGLLGIVVAPVIEHTIKKHKSDAVADLINHWNAYFFHPRHLSVVLARGTESFSGSCGEPPDLAQYMTGNTVVECEESSGGEDDHNAETPVAKRARQRKQNARDVGNEMRPGG